MLSALFYAERGHNVVIYEKDNTLGGIINDFEKMMNFILMDLITSILIHGGSRNYVKINV